MIFHELGDDLILAAKLVFESADLRGLDRLGLLGAFTVAGEGEVAVLEEFLLPVAEDAGLGAVLITQIGDGDFVDEMAAQDRHEAEDAPFTAMGRDPRGIAGGTAKRRPLLLDREEHSTLKIVGAHITVATDGHR